ncbi:uncharacterized protein F4807DRAFT_398079 [Annulohypoxylon truncatum]|uniref:uncharacterized protein n=1 Tax=Annulohypoxylon truncatum TaxID=327061 RepID=UPI002007DADA|nr:uncharacterized protein F4807DRAFT_398079 [Annulohypoxylon truncatum]KAI1211671.1 hypothetical protein F4807DRAFT_398079 [Annulohypoxylon truncatum]
MATCKVCEQPLVLEVEDEDGNDEQEFVPDDLEVSCGCHFHWQCLLDQAAELAKSLKCPSCAAEIATRTAGPSTSNPFVQSVPGAAILTRYTNEGGIQENYDILPEVTEEAYVEANPEVLPARAYHVMCSTGDVENIVAILRETEQARTERHGRALSATQLIRYQDPLEDSKSGLHLAIEKGQEEVVWLLLWIASTLSTESFPRPAVQKAQAMGIQRPSALASGDIRALKDNQGRTAEAAAAQMGDFWTAILQSGILHPDA